MNGVRLLSLLLLLAAPACVSPTGDDDDTAGDDDSVGPGDDDTGDDDTVVADDDDTVDPLDPATTPGRRLCSSAGTGQDGTYTWTACTGPVELAPGVMSDGNYTARVNALRVRAP